MWIITHTHIQREREREILRFYHRERVVFSSCKFREKSHLFYASSSSLIIAAETERGVPVRRG